VNGGKSGTATVSIVLATVSSVSVSPKTASVSVGGTRGFSAVVTGIGGPSQQVGWELVGYSTGTPSGTTIDDKGLLSVSAGETLTSLTVKASSVANQLRFDTATVSVVKPTITSVVVSPKTARVPAGGSFDFSAVVIGNGGHSQEVDWTVDGGATISGAGRLTLTGTQPAGTLTVRATSRANPGVSDTATVTVTVPTVSSVLVQPGIAYVAVGDQIEFRATVMGTNGPPQTVDWTIEETGKSGGTSIDGDGILTVASDELLASLTVRATSTLDSGVYGTATVRTTQAGTSVSVLPATALVRAGGSRKFTLVDDGTGNTLAEVFWVLTGNKNANTKIASDGMLTVAAGETSNTVTVWGYHAASGRNGFATVRTDTVTGIKIHTPGVPMNAAVDLKHTVSGTDGIPQTVIWSLEGSPAKTTLVNGKLTSGLAPGTIIKVKATSPVDPSAAVTADIPVGTPVALSQYFMYTVSRDGRLLGFGKGTSDHPGMGPKTQIAAPAGGIAVLASGFDHSGAYIDSDGFLWSWGNVGWESTAVRPSPVKMGTKRWRSVSVGNQYGLAIDEDGKLWGWGNNSGGKVGTGDPTGTTASVIKEVQQASANTAAWVAVTAGTSHSLGLKADGTMWAWGSNSYYQTGLGTESGYSEKATLVTTLSGNWKYISQITAYYDNNFAIDTNNDLYAWGYSNSGSNGLYASGSASNNGNVGSKPTKVGTATGYRFISAGRNHSLAVRTNGTLWAWGSYSSGKLGIPTVTSNTHIPQQVPGTDWVYTQAGYASSIGITADGRIWFWGTDVPLRNAASASSITVPTVQDLQ